MPSPETTAVGQRRRAQRRQRIAPSRPHGDDVADLDHTRVQVTVGPWSQVPPFDAETKVVGVQVSTTVTPARRANRSWSPETVGERAARDDLGDPASVFDDRQVDVRSRP